MCKHKQPDLAGVLKEVPSIKDKLLHSSVYYKTLTTIPQHNKRLMGKCVLYLTFEFFSLFWTGNTWTISCCCLFSALPKPTTTFSLRKKQGEKRKLSFWVAGRWKGFIVSQENSNSPNHLFCVRRMKTVSLALCLPSSSSPLVVETIQLSCPSSPWQWGGTALSSLSVKCLMN